LLEDLGPIDLDGIDWMIVGGASGAGARPMAKEWVLSLLDQCRKQQVKFFFKQWGGVRKSTTGRRLNGRTYDELPARRIQLVNSAEECAQMALAFEMAYPANAFIPLSAISEASILAT
jgi:hypothetical protein